MSIHNNFPAISWIKLDGISITKGEDVYVVKDFKTNLKYIYWSLDAHDQLTASNVMLSRTSSRFLIAINNKGECILVPNEEIVVSFDGNSVDSITEHIWGLYEKDEQYGNKFVSVEQNIEGITHTIGQTQEELGKVSERVTKVDQKADSINLSVQNLNREYNSDKEMQELRENVNGSIIDINSAIGIFKSQITDIFKDNEISEDESVAIQSQMDILEERKLKVIDQVDRVILLMELEGNLSEVVSLTSQKQAFVNSIDNLSSLVGTSILDGTIVPSEITVVTDAFGRASVEINTLKNTIDEIIFLGIGGIISEELANISMKSDEIVLSVHKVEEKVDNDTAYLKNELANQIKDVSDELVNLEDTMNTSFLDGVLSDSEKIALKTNLENLATEKLGVDKQYETIYNNSDLTGTSKTELNKSYNTYIQKYNDLVSEINTVVNKEENVDINDQSNINSCIVAYRNALGNFSEKASNAIDTIAENKVNTVDGKYAEIILDPETGITSKVEHINNKIEGENGLEYRLQSAEEKITPSSITQVVQNSQVIKDIQSGITTNRQNISSVSQRADSISWEVSQKVGTNSIISAINQTAESIKINASKINLNGYVTFSELNYELSDYLTDYDLGYYGTTTIHGDRIRTGTLSVDKIGASSSNPIIQLFYGNGLNCALDATAYMNEGVGSAIRLKRDDNNYVYVGNGNIAFYCTGSNNNESALCTISGNTSTFNMNTKGGTLQLSSGVYYNGVKLSDVNHTHSNYASSSHTHSNYASSSHTHSNYATTSSLNSYLPKESTSICLTGSHSPYHTNTYNCGWSSQRWQQVSAQNGYFNNSYLFAVDNPVATVSTLNLDNVIDDIIIEDSTTIQRSGFDDKLVINVNTLKENDNGHLFISEDDGGNVVVNEGNLLVLALKEIKDLKTEVRKIDTLENEINNLNNKIDFLTNKLSELVNN